MRGKFVKFSGVAVLVGVICALFVLPAQADDDFWVDSGEPQVVILDAVCNTRDQLVQVWVFVDNIDLDVHARTALYFYNHSTDQTMISHMGSINTSPAYWSHYFPLKNGDGISNGDVIDLRFELYYDFYPSDVIDVDTYSFTCFDDHNLPFDSSDPDHEVREGLLPDDLLLLTR